MAFVVEDLVERQRTVFYTLEFVLDVSEMVVAFPGTSAVDV